MFKYILSSIYYRCGFSTATPEYSLNKLNKNTSNKIKRHTNIQPGKPICLGEKAIAT